MNNNNQIKNEINKSMELFDGFNQPSVSDDLAKRITKNMSQEYKSQAISKMFFKISSSIVAAAAILIIGFMLFANMNTNTEKIAPKQIVTANQISADTEAILIQWAQQEKNAYGFYDDLNFEISQTAQLAQTNTASQPTTLNGDEEWDTMILSIFTETSSS